MAQSGRIPILNQRQRLLVVSNRLPVTVTKQEDQWIIQPGSGGLITALAPVLRDRGGLWCGWSGATIESAAPVESLLHGQEGRTGFRLQPVQLSERELKNFYFGFANETLWPLFHDLLGRARFEQGYWEAYLAANRRYNEVLTPGDFPEITWVHDYHLIPLGAMLRAHGREGRIGFFLHIPFPPLDLFKRLPWRKELLNHFLAYDLVGFQTRRDYTNFMNCVREMLPELPITSAPWHAMIHTTTRLVHVHSFPISIDFQEFNTLAKSLPVQETAALLRGQYPNQKIILGLDRLDYTKGIIPRFRAFRECLRLFPELHSRVVLLQVIIPSRIEVPEYQQMKRELEQLLAQINGEFSRPGWVPIHYFYRSLDRQELAAWYRAADICLVTPIKDGMNLVCKEYCACSPDGGVLILSEFAGAAEQLKEGALLVNPFDLEGVANTIGRACTMSREEQFRRMTTLRNHLRRNNVYIWVEHFVEQLLEPLEI